MENNVWYFENFNFYNILCPFKLEDHSKKTPHKIYHKNEFLFMEEEPCTNIFLIDKGKVKISQYDKEGNERVITFLGKGQILGQLALLGQNRYRVFAEVMEEGTQVCEMSVAKAKALTRDYVPFAIEMNRRIDGHIRRLERRIEILLSKNVKTRLIEFIKDLAIDYGRNRDEGIWISHELTQSDIASIIGTSRKSTSLLLNELADKGFIEFDRKHIFIPNPKQLNIVISQIGI